ncbi:uncharacterized protein A4U43_C01F13680 [Asparagus officinalis]|uniref:Uncharacterized protein n=1 Tax=Asparagus officinalis TaxID=4686 RepID=A0A5P1FTP1_ASPOF|nr:uncharacterized protein A4U43_C01F13680 [Asparagus officinalis]
MSSVALSDKERAEKKKKQYTLLVYPFLITHIYKDQSILTLPSDYMEKGRATLCDETARKSLGFLMDTACRIDPSLPTPLVYVEFVLDAARGYDHEEMDKDDD